MSETKDLLSKLETNVKVNSLNAWILAARPKTLTGASVPIMIGIAFVFYRHRVGAFPNYSCCFMCILRFHYANRC